MAENAFRTALAGFDLDRNFLCREEFGEDVTLLRNGERFCLPGLYDSPGIGGEDLGVELEAISHRPRLFVRTEDLPAGRPAKGDIFELEGTEFHPAMRLRAVDFLAERDGVVVYRLIESKGA